MKIIIFDIDGTIFDTKIGIINCLNDVLQSYGKLAIKSEAQDRYIGPAIKDSLIKYNQFPEDLAVEATKQYREKYIANYVKDSIPYEGLFELLRLITEKGCKICIATMKTREQVDKLLDSFRISGMFDCIETAKEEGGYSKYDMLESIKKKYYGSEFIFVGDTIGDYKASLKAGIPFVYAKYGYGIIDRFNGYEVSNLSELKQFF